MQSLSLEYINTKYDYLGNWAEPQICACVPLFRFTRMCTLIQFTVIICKDTNPILTISVTSPDTEVSVTEDVYAYFTVQQQKELLLHVMQKVRCLRTSISLTGQSSEQ